LLDLSRVEEQETGGFRHITYGHTHLPEHSALEIGWDGRQSASIYLNTGTWRRVHLFGRRRSNNTPYFADFNEETYVIVRCSDERDGNGPGYEFRRNIRG
jgi:hypothetical protein